VAYSSGLIPEWWRLLYSLNPMAGVVEGFRWALLGQQSLPGAPLLLSVLIVAVVFVGGLFYFRRMDFEFADVV
jgi:lipopolysaccharide transport system permease protein